MKAYPLIYSRTKYEDFVPDFLVRPEDLDYMLANKFTKTIMSQLDMIDRIRYAVYPVDKKYVCIGIASCTKEIVEVIKSKNSNYINKHPDIEEYLKDTKGRKTNCFIGIAIPISVITRNKIPDISLEEYMDLYLEYIKHQWNNEDKTESEKLKDAPLEIREKDYDNSFTPDFELVGGKKVVKNYDSNENNVIDYYFHKIAEGMNESFITDINDRNEWSNMLFTSAVVDPDLVQSLKVNPVIPKRESFSKPRVDNNEVMIKKTPISQPKETKAPQIEKSEKKKNSGVILALAAAVVVAVVVLVAVIL